MKIHEYQAKEFLRTYGISVPRGKPVRTPQEAGEYARETGVYPLVLKAQIHAGGRGKGGGIKIVDSPGELEAAAARLFGTRLVTPQTGPEGRPVETLLIEEVLPVERELYLAVAIDRPNKCVTVLASAEGGMEIERVAADTPGKLITERVHPGVGLRPFQTSRISYSLALDPSVVRTMNNYISSLYHLFVDKDCSLAEINPLVLTKRGELVALDGKINIDDNGLFRHPDLAALRDVSQEDPLEVEASKHNLNYIKLKGTVGCMVNGAGLAMATMDLIQHAGAMPANFLDVGGGATSEMVKEGLKILLSDADVRVIFINIFGGILRCDTLAKGVVEAARDLSITIPVVIRLEGTNVEAGRKILDESGLAFTVAHSLKDAAEKVRAALLVRSG
jgi:succinyl-CoA synthetase beta subunit